MNGNIKVSASILCADFTKLGEEIKACEKAGVDMLHIDVMDGHFVPNITIGQVMVQAIRKITKLPLEAHLMIENPWDYIDSFAENGADIISIHAECYGERRKGCRERGRYPKEVDTIDVKRARGDIQKIKAKGVKAFFVVNPGTPLCFDELLGDLDGVLVMSVNPGFAKQKFNPVALPKIRELRKKFKGDIEIDGGVNAETAQQAVEAGANILATASYFFGSSDKTGTVEFLKGFKAVKH